MPQMMPCYWILVFALVWISFFCFLIFINDFFLFSEEKDLSLNKFSYSESWLK